MIKYPSIEQYRTAVSNFKSLHSYRGKDEEGKPIYVSVDSFPKLRYRGTVKLHGTHADVVQNEDGEIYYQSRNNIINILQDNAGFAAFASKIEDEFKHFFDIIRSKMTTLESIVLAGEFCGGNIQKGVALSKLDKMFVIYGIKVGENFVDVNKFVDVKCHEKKIYHILEFEHWETDFDFEHVSVYQNYLVEKTKQVEHECPVGKYFGVSGVGEGIVWNCLGSVEDDKVVVNDFSFNPALTFKVKGDEHAVTKVKTLVEVDLELENDINKLVDIIVTENRLKQGLDYLREQHVSFEIFNINEFIKWVVGDVVKEEKERIKESKVDEKKFFGNVKKKSGNWFKQYLNFHLNESTADI